MNCSLISLAFRADLPRVGEFLESRGLEIGAVLRWPGKGKQFARASLRVFYFAIPHQPWILDLRKKAGEVQENGTGLYGGIEGSQTNDPVRLLQKNIEYMQEMLRYDWSRTKGSIQASWLREWMRKYRKTFEAYHAGIESFLRDPRVATKDQQIALQCAADHATSAPKELIDNYIRRFDFSGLQVQRRLAGFKSLWRNVVLGLASVDVQRRGDAWVAVVKTAGVDSHGPDADSRAGASAGLVTLARALLSNDRFMTAENEADAMQIAEQLRAGLKEGKMVQNPPVNGLARLALKSDLRPETSQLLTFTWPFLSALLTGAQEFEVDTSSAHYHLELGGHLRVKVETGIYAIMRDIAYKNWDISRDSVIYPWFQEWRPDAENENVAGAFGPNKTEYQTNLEAARNMAGDRVIRAIRIAVYNSGEVVVFPKDYNFGWAATQAAIERRAGKWPVIIVYESLWAPLIHDLLTGSVNPFPLERRVRIKGTEVEGHVISTNDGAVSTRLVRFDDPEQADDSIPAWNLEIGVHRSNPARFEPETTSTVTWNRDSFRLGGHAAWSVLGRGTFHHDHGELASVSEDVNPDSILPGGFKRLQERPAYSVYRKGDWVYLLSALHPHTTARIRSNTLPGSQPLFDSEGRRYSADYIVVEGNVDGRSSVVTSHQPSNLQTWTPGYPREFQTRDLGSPSEASKIASIARNLDPERLLEPHLDATLGPPVAWQNANDGRYYILGGNGRAIGLLLAPQQRYQAYLDAGAARWPCWPLQPARPGHRWMMLRVVRGIGREEAGHLAAASQLSTSASEGRIGSGLGIVRSLNLDVLKLPPIRWTEPINASSIAGFASVNGGFVREVLRQMDAAKRASYANDADKLSTLVASVLLGFFPEEARAIGSWISESPRVEDALIGALPGMLTSRSMALAREIHPEYDLLAALPEALEVFRWLHARKLSFAKFKAALEQESHTGKIDESIERISDTPPLSIALAAAMYNASRRAAPEVAVSEMLAGYLEEAGKYNPTQTGLFGDANYPDPAYVLAGRVKAFELPLPTIPTQTLLAANPRRMVIGALVFDKNVFLDRSSVRGWAKRMGIHAGVPAESERTWTLWMKGNREAPARLQVPVDRGVTSLLRQA